MARLRALVTLVFAFGAVAGAATASTITYSGTGTLSFVSGSDLFHLSGTSWTISSKLATDQVPISSSVLADGGLQDVFAGTASIVGEFRISLPDQITFTWYPHPTATEVDSIMFSASGTFDGLPLSISTLVDVALPAATPKPLARTAIPTSTSFSVQDSTIESATFDVLTGSVHGAGPASTPEPGTLSMLGGGALLAALFAAKRRVQRSS